MRSKIAVIGSGISGLSAAWLLSQRHEITLFEKEWRAGGHSRTVEVDLPGKGSVPVDTGFIVFNEATYPNFTRLLDHLGVATRTSDMSFAVSLDGGAFEYSGGAKLKGLFAQRRNLLSPRFWSMLRDLIRFYREAPAHAGRLGLATLGEFLASGKYGPAFRDDHLLPMAAAIWSAPCHSILDYPAESFIRFCENHGLLQIGRRPRWRTVEGASRAYVEQLLAGTRGRIQLGRGAARVTRSRDGVWIHDTDGGVELFDQVVIAAHADQALALLADPTPAEAGAALRLPLQPQQRDSARRSEADAAPAQRLVELELSRPSHARRRHGRPLRLLLDEPAAGDRPSPAADHDAEPQSRADARQRDRQRDLRSSLVRQCGDGGAARLLADPGREPHLVLRRLARRGLPRGRAAGRARGGRGDRRAAALAPRRAEQPHPRDAARTGAGGMNSALYAGTVVHQRLRPKRHRLKYRLAQGLFDLDELDAVAGRLRFLSRNRFNLFAFHDRDYGDGSDTPLRDQIETHLQGAGLEPDGGPIRLLAMPRVLGHIFNPIAIWFCHRRDEQPAGDRLRGHQHAEAAPLLSDPGDRRAADGAIRQSCAKTLYVSPFMDMDMAYDFAIRPPGEKVQIVVNGRDAEGPLISASFTGHAAP